MQAPRVQYAKTTDGVRIAYTVSGGGPPLVVLSEPTASHVELEWSQPVLGETLSLIASRMTLIRLDVRTTGLSDRVKEPGVDPVDADVRAVLQAVGLERYSLGGVQSLTPAAIIYASRHPAEVQSLVLVDPVLRVLDMVATPPMAAVIAAAFADWTMATEMLGSQVFGVGRFEAGQFGKYIRECVDADFYNVALRAADVLDATDAAAEVHAPTLVIRHADHSFISADVTRDVTSAIRGASLVTIPGRWGDHPEALAKAVTGWVLEH